MTTVKAKLNESFESLLRRFKKAVDHAGILADFKKHEFYEKPSIRKKRKKEAARKRAVKKLKKLARFNWRNTSGKSFRWNKDKTEKIPMKPNPYGDKNKPAHRKSTFNKPKSKEK